MTGFHRFGASSRPAPIDPARASGARDTRALGSGLSAFGEQINRSGPPLSGWPVQALGEDQEPAAPGDEPGDGGLR